MGLRGQSRPAPARAPALQPTGLPWLPLGAALAWEAAGAQRGATPGLRSRGLQPTRPQARTSRPSPRDCGPVRTRRWAGGGHGGRWSWHTPGPAPGAWARRAGGRGGGGGRSSSGAPAEGPLRPRPPQTRGRAEEPPSAERSLPPAWAPSAGQQRRPVAECPPCRRWPGLPVRGAPLLPGKGLFSPEQMPGGGGAG